MSGLWRITVDSWITDNAKWYGRREFFIAANDLPAAMRAVADLSPQEYLDESGLELRDGTTEQARNDHRIWVKNNLRHST